MAINLIRELRFRKGITQDELFLKTKIHQARISRLERGIFKASPQERKLISEALEVSEEEVFPEA